MLIVERSESHQVLADTGQLLASFPTRREAEAFQAGFRVANEHARRVANQEREAMGLALSRMSL
jgi:hypothetical protein